MIRRLRSLLALQRSDTPGKYLMWIGVASLLAMSWVAIGLRTGIPWPGLAAIGIGAAVAIAAIAIPRPRFAMIFNQHFGWIPVALGTISIPFWYWSIKTYGQPHHEFFGVAAAILPVLILAAVVDVRRSATLKSYQLAMPMLAAFFAEIAALNEVAFGGQQDSDLQQQLPV